ncbi:MAG: cation transporter [Bacillota bacterium]|nr:cation transporter [Bacillota bacterium]
MKKTIFIEGMACGHCKKAVEKALQDLDGVTSVEVSLQDQKALVHLEKDISNSTLQAVIKDAGYEVIKIQ